MKTLLLAIALLLGVFTAPLPGQETNNSDSVPIENAGVPTVGVDGHFSHMWGVGGAVQNVLLPIVIIAIVFGTPVAIIGLVLFFKHRRNRILHETLRAMVEKGVPIPPELLSEPGASAANAAKAGARGSNDLRAGLIVSGVGAGLMFFGVKAGLIPLFIGLALIVSWFITNKTRNNQTPQ